MKLHHEELGPYLARLREIPFVGEAHLAELEPQGGPRRAYAAVDIQIDGRKHRYLVELKRTPRLDYALVNALRGQLAHAPGPWMLFTPFVTTPMAEQLHNLGIDFVDLAGNCRLIVDEGHTAIVQGRRPPVQAEEGHTFGPAGFQVLFALLARPELLNTTVREIGTWAGVGKTAVAVVQRRLTQAGLLGRTRTRTFILRPKDALERWVAGYRDVLRPRLLVGRYQAAERDPFELERRVERILEFPGADPAGGQTPEDPAPPTPWRWAWGGVTAAYRMTGHYRGDETLLHVDRAGWALPEKLRVLPARTGNLTILRVPAPLALDGAFPGTAHPLLVYTELLMNNDDRAAEAAAEIHERFLHHLQ